MPSGVNVDATYALGGGGGLDRLHCPGSCACTSFTYVIYFEPSRPSQYANTVQGRAHVAVFANCDGRDGSKQITYVNEVHAHDPGQ